jgi:hypothetical protein
MFRGLYFDVECIQKLNNAVVFLITGLTPLIFCLDSIFKSSCSMDEERNRLKISPPHPLMKIYHSYNLHNSQIYLDGQ